MLRSERFYLLLLLPPLRYVRFSKLGKVDRPMRRGLCTRADIRIGLVIRVPIPTAIMRDGGRTLTGETLGERAPRADRVAGGGLVSRGGASGTFVQL